MLRELARASGDDEAFAREVLGAFLESAPGLAARLDDSARAGDSARAASEAHGLKGISLAIGAEGLAEACQAAEHAAARGDMAALRSAVAAVGPAWERLKGDLSGVIEMVP